jgi:hypothetical protein
VRLRNRTINAEFWTDPELLRWHRDKRATYEGLWCLCEDSGCLEDDAFGWKLAIWPSPLDSDITVEVLQQWRDEMVADGKLIAYEADGKKYVYLKNFHQYQRPRNPQSPNLPLPSFVTWECNDKDTRKGHYVLTSVVQEVNERSPLDCSGLDKAGLDQTVEASDNASLSNFPPCLNQSFKFRFTGEEDFRDGTGRQLLLQSLEATLGPAWVMKPTNLGQAGEAIRSGCLPDCKGSKNQAQSCCIHLIKKLEDKRSWGLVRKCWKEDREDARVR